MSHIRKCLVSSRSNKHRHTLATLILVRVHGFGVSIIQMEIVKMVCDTFMIVFI